MEPPRAPPLPLRRVASAPTTNTLLNKYELGQLLGRGSFAKVYVGRDLTNDAAKDKLVAVKVIDKTRTEAAMEPKIICEISTMRRLQHHPNVLKIHEVMATKTKIYLIMQLASGGDLFSKVVQRGKLKESSARRYFQQLVSALHFCHQNGIAHRDVKPQNLLLDEKGVLKVSDFGLSALAEGKTDGGMLHTACGTPGFSAPEVMTRRDGGYDGAKADAWSCGVILFFLLSAALPFDDSNIATIYRRVYKREYQMPSWISRPAKSIINQLLDPNPTRRMSIESLTRHSWFRKDIELPNRSGLLELDHVNSCKQEGSVSPVNAFDIISLSSGLDLSGLFEAANKREKRFTSKETLERIRGRVKEVGGRFGYNVLEGKGIGTIGLGKGSVVFVFEVLEIAESFFLVEVRAVEGGGGLESEEVHWCELKDGLEDVVFQWHNDDVLERERENKNMLYGEELGPG